MKRQTIVELLMFVALVAVGAAVRVYLQDLPNFAPVAALALFAGYFFRSRVVAVAVPALVMMISDSIIGGYAWWIMLTVYGMLAMPVLLRGVLRKYLSLEGSSWRPIARSLVGLTACSLASSIPFFLVTNFPAWLAFGTYDRTLFGLLHCYYQAIPFFRFTVMGDLTFAILLFGGYALAVNLLRAESSAPETCANPAA